MSHLMTTLFGPNTWGAGGNLVAWVICGIPSTLLALWHHRRQISRDLDRFRELDQAKEPQQPGDGLEDPPPEAPPP
jgi:hypothetical protein